MTPIERLKWILASSECPLIHQILLSHTHKHVCSESPQLFIWSRLSFGKCGLFVQMFHVSISPVPFLHAEVPLGDLSWFCTELFFPAHFAQWRFLIFYRSRKGSTSSCTLSPHELRNSWALIGGGSGLTGNAADRAVWKCGCWFVSIFKDGGYRRCTGPWVLTNYSTFALLTVPHLKQELKTCLRTTFEELLTFLAHATWGNLIQQFYE